MPVTDSSHRSDVRVQVRITELAAWIPGLPEWRGWLQPEESARAARFHASADAERWAAGRAFLRSVLGTHAGIHPSAVRFLATAGGKPYLAADGPFFFNYSRSGGLAATAMTSVAEVGIDIEAIVEDRDLFGMARRFFAPGEVSALLDQSSMAEAFYRCWTRKEAVVKAEGGGLSIPLDAFEVSLGPAPMVRGVADGMEWVNGYTLFDLAVRPGVAGAVAVAGEAVGIEADWITAPDRHEDDLLR